MMNDLNDVAAAIADEIELASESPTELEKNALERRERLKGIREKISLVKSTENGNEEVGGPLLLFRSYKPINPEITTKNLSNVNKLEHFTVVDNLIKDQIEASYETSIKETLDINALAPRKVDWDLQRGVQDKLDLLNQNTEKAIRQLIKQRLEAGETDLLALAVKSTQLINARSTTTNEDENN